MSEWEKLFNPAIPRRGRELYRYNSVSGVREDGYNNFSATVEGTNGYHVTLTLNSGEVESPSCTCAYAQSAVYCKHIAAVLLKIEADYGKDVFFETGYSEKRSSLKDGSSDEYAFHTLVFEDDEKPHYLSLGSSLDIYKPTLKTLHKATSLISNGKLVSRKVKTNVKGSEKQLSYTVEVHALKGTPALVTIVLGRDGIRGISCFGWNQHFRGFTVEDRQSIECGISQKDRDGVIELCVHKTAALLDLFNYLRENRDIIDYSDSKAQQLLSSFTVPKKLYSNTAGERRTEPVDIEPEITDSLMTLRITGGEGKSFLHCHFSRRSLM